LLESVLDPSRFCPLQAGTHGLQLLRRMADPVEELTDNAERLTASKRLRRVSRELLVGDVGVVFEVACRLDHVDSPAALTRGEFGSPRCRVESGGEVDVVSSKGTGSRSSLKTVTLRFPRLGPLDAEAVRNQSLDVRRVGADLGVRHGRTQPMPKQILPERPPR
jgi:hypothetical protein